MEFSITAIESLITLAGVDAIEPPGLSEFGMAILGWVKWVGIASGLFGIFVIAIMMMLGRRNRSQVAADGMSALPWIVGGFFLLGSSAALASWILGVGEDVSSVDFHRTPYYSEAEHDAIRDDLTGQRYAGQGQEMFEAQQNN